MKRILLADDDQSVRKMVARVLETAGYLVVVTTSSGSVVEEFQSNRPDLLVMDLRLPDPDSWKRVEAITLLDPKIPIIMTTAWSNLAEQAAGRRISALMEKPLDLPILLKTIKDLLSESEPAHGITAVSPLRDANWSLNT